MEYEAGPKIKPKETTENAVHVCVCVCFSKNLLLEMILKFELISILILFGFWFSFKKTPFGGTGEIASVKQLSCEHKDMS